MSYVFTHVTRNGKLERASFFGAAMLDLFRYFSVTLSFSFSNLARVYSLQSCELVL